VPNELQHVHYLRDGAAARWCRLAYHAGPSNRFLFRTCRSSRAVFVSLNIYLTHSDQIIQSVLLKITR
jgi:hypothetical protein